ncbi:MAG: uroporphyrinogen decarboxylase family protein [Bacteroidales bacterium]|nr:uroporphyrinogen decarboxylase family protein [Bacteroidales bacterium]
MRTKKQIFDDLAANGTTGNGFLFRPILMHFAARYHGITYGELASDHRKLVGANIHCMEDFETDMVGLISDPYRETAAFGAPIRFVPEGVPVCEKKIINNIEDAKDLKIPDIKKAERTLDRLKGAAFYQEKLKGTLPVIGWVEGPLAEACDLAGVTEVLMKLVIDPDFVRLLMDKCLQTGIEFACAQVDAGCDIIGIGDAICSQIDRSMYEGFVKERHRELIRAIHDKGAKVKMHICGDITHLLPAMKGLGIDILDIDWQVDPDTAYIEMGPGTIRCGNINPVTIQDVSSDILAEKTIQLLRNEKDRRFILSGGCEISVLTPPENLKVLSETSKQTLQ